MYCWMIIAMIVFIIFVVEVLGKKCFCQKVWKFSQIMKFWMIVNYFWKISLKAKGMNMKHFWKYPLIYNLWHCEVCVKVIIICEESYGFPHVFKSDQVHFDTGHKPSEHFMAYVFLIDSFINHYYSFCMMIAMIVFSIFVVEVFEKMFLSKAVGIFLKSWSFAWLWRVSEIFHQSQKLLTWKRFWKCSHV